MRICPIDIRHVFAIATKNAYILFSLWYGCAPKYFRIIFGYSTDREKEEPEITSSPFFSHLKQNTKNDAFWKASAFCRTAQTAQSAHTVTDKAYHQTQRHDIIMHAANHRVFFSPLVLLLPLLFHHSVQIRFHSLTRQMQFWHILWPKRMHTVCWLHLLVSPSQWKSFSYGSTKETNSQMQADRKRTSITLNEWKNRRKKSISSTQPTV